MSEYKIENHRIRISPFQNTVIKITEWIPNSNKDASFDGGNESHTQSTTTQRAALTDVALA
jgi:hypothetical protein